MKFTVLLTLVFLLITAVGCNSVGGDDSDSSYQQDDCPDQYAYTKEVTLTSGVNQFGHPLDDKTTFSADIPEIFSVFYLSQDLCCRDVVVKWYYQDTLLSQHTETSSNNFVVSLKSPEGGFMTGNYEMLITIEGEMELIWVPFTVV